MPLSASDWPRWQRLLDERFGAPLPGSYRGVAEDFVVEELLDFTPEGQGEHLWLFIEKRGQTTLDVVRTLGRLCKADPREIGYSGMKDRIAITRQWLSVQLPGREPPEGLETALGESGIKVLQSHRHPRKLKRGVHRRNRFTLRLSGPAMAEQALTPRWQHLCEQGVPNYFGPQRFGPEGRNLFRAEALLAKGWRKRDDRHGMLLSSARSFLFNTLLSARIEEGSWATPCHGDTLMLDGTQSLFAIDEVDETLYARAGRLDVHPTAPLWGTGVEEQGAMAVHAQTLEKTYPALCAGLERSGVAVSRRALRMRLSEPRLEREALDRVVLSFELPKGSFATAVISELIAHPDFEPVTPGAALSP